MCYYFCFSKLAGDRAKWVDSEKFVDNLSDDEVNSVYSLIGFNTKVLQTIDQRRDALIAIKYDQVQNRPTLPSSDPEFEKICDQYRNK